MTPAPWITGLDGKRYPRSAPRGDVRNRLINVEHGFHHRGYSIRRIQVIVKRVFGIERSVGTIHSDLNGWLCDSCPGRSPQPEQAAETQPEQPGTPSVQVMHSCPPEQPEAIET